MATAFRSVFFVLEVSGRREIEVDDPRHGIVKVFAIDGHKSVVATPMFYAIVSNWARGGDSQIRGGGGGGGGGLPAAQRLEKP